MKLGNTTKVVLLALLSFCFLWEALFSGLDLYQGVLSSCPQSVTIKEERDLLDPSFGSENPIFGSEKESFLID